MRDRANERSPSPISRICSFGWKGIVGCECWTWECGFDFGVDLGAFDMDAGRVRVLRCLWVFEGLEESLWRLFFPILKDFLTARWELRFRS